MILALGALLASAFLADTFSRELPSPSLRLGSTLERVEDRALHASVPTSDAQRIALVRSALPAIARLKSPNGGGPDGHRGTDMVATPAEQFELGGRGAPGDAVEARRDGVRSPGQPPPSSRAPPIG
jgi:hypothetical protein